MKKIFGFAFIVGSFLALYSFETLTSPPARPVFDFSAADICQTYTGDVCDKSAFAAVQEGLWQLSLRHEIMPTNAAPAVDIWASGTALRTRSNC